MEKGLHHFIGLPCWTSIYVSQSITASLLPHTDPVVGPSSLVISSCISLALCIINRVLKRYSETVAEGDGTKGSGPSVVCCSTPLTQFVVQLVHISMESKVQTIRFDRTNIIPLMAFPLFCLRFWKFAESWST